MKKLYFFLVLMMILSMNTELLAKNMFSLPKTKDIKITGKITDIDSKEGIANVSVITPDSITTSRFDGHFVIRFKTRGKFEVKFEKKGYVTKIMRFSDKNAGLGINVEMKQKMGSLIGVIHGCIISGRKHIIDDMSEETIKLEGTANSGQKIHLTVDPQAGGDFAIFNLPLGKYTVSDGREKKDFEIKKIDQIEYVVFVRRWCMRKELHTNMKKDETSFKNFLMEGLKQEGPEK